MYATLRNNQLITPGHNGAQFVIRGIVTKGRYQVRTCRQRGDIIEFGSGWVEVTPDHLVVSDYLLRTVRLRITDHKVEILTPAHT